MYIYVCMHSSTFMSSFSIFSKFIIHVFVSLLSVDTTATNIAIYGAALLGPPSPPHPMVSPVPPVVPCGVGSPLPLPTVVAVGSPLPPVVPCGVGSPLPLPTVVAVGCAPFHGYCWLGVWRPVAKGLDLRM